MATFYSDDTTRNDAIMRRLVGRLEQGATPSSFARTTVDAVLLTDVANQAEDRLTRVIRQRYQWPLSSPTIPLLQEIVEKLAVCALLPIHYHGPAPSNESNDYQRIVCKQADKALEDIKSGCTSLDETLITSPHIFRDTKTVKRKRTAIEEIDFCSSGRGNQSRRLSRRNRARF